MEEIQIMEEARTTTGDISRISHIPHMRIATSSATSSSPHTPDMSRNEQKDLDVDDWTCSVCLDEDDWGPKASSTTLTLAPFQCQHRYHAACFQQLIMYGHSHCPECRSLLGCPTRLNRYWVFAWVRSIVDGAADRSTSYLRRTAVCCVYFALGTAYFTLLTLLWSLSIVFWSIVTRETEETDKMVYHHVALFVWFVCQTNGLFFISVLCSLHLLGLCTMTTQLEQQYEEDHEL